MAEPVPPSQPDPPPSEAAVREVLQEPLEALAKLGLHRPHRRTLEAFLDHLAEHQVISSATAAAFAALHQEMRYGGKEIDLSVAGDVSRRLMAEIERFGQLPQATRDDVIRHVCAEPATSDATFPDPAELQPDSVEQIARMANQRDPAEHLKPRRRLSDDNRIRIFGVAFIVWSLVMIFLGFGLSDHLEPLVMDIKLRLFGDEAMPESLDDLELFRQFAARHPENQRIWRLYGDSAAHNHAYNEAIMAYHYTLVRHREDAETLNNLAWLYCTADDVVYRDIDLGLEYAQRAWELSQRAHIADTLAEANFLNGNIERAIELETRALEMARGPDERQFYEEQLARFREAAGNQAAPSAEE